MYQLRIGQVQARREIDQFGEDTAIRRSDLRFGCHIFMI
jgi:hypothetical protein